MYNLSWDAAFWVTNYVANQAYNRYSQMIPDIRRVQNEIEDSIAAEVDSMRSAVASMPETEASATLTAHTARWARDYTKRYKQLGDYLLVKYLDGNVKREKDGKFERTADGMPVSPLFPGYDDRYYHAIATDPDGGDRLKSLKIQ